MSADSETVQEEISAEEADAFLADISEVTRRHGLEVAGCGCCGSPFLLRVRTRNGRYFASLTNEGWVEQIRWEVNDA